MELIKDIEVLKQTLLCTCGIASLKPPYPHLDGVRAVEEVLGEDQDKVGRQNEVFWNV